MSMKKAFWFGILLWLAYIGCRIWLQHMIPATTYHEFIKQDLCITGFRLLLLYFTLDLARRTMTREELGFRQGPVLPALAAGALFLTIDLVRLFPLEFVQAKPLYFIVELAINLLVGINEDISFRGLFFVCLKKMKGRNWAIYLGSVLFTLMHWGYQPLAGFPLIFLTGVTFAKLRSMGVSLTVLILIHGILDFAFFVFSPYHKEFSVPLFNALHLIPLAVVFGWDYLQKRKAAPQVAGT